MFLFPDFCLKRCFYIPRSIEQICLWPTNWAGIRLGMKAPVQRILILTLAFPTHREHTHRRLFAIIRHILDNRKARSAIRAVDKGIVEVPVSWIEEFKQAVVTSSSIRRDERFALGTSLAMSNDESRIVTQ